MSIRDLANWVLDQSAWWLIPYVLGWLVVATIAAFLNEAV